MTTRRESFVVPTTGRSIVDVTAQVQAVVGRAGVSDGLCTVFIHHTSASLLITENADADVLVDLEAWVSRQVKDGDPLFVHTAEGPDDMSAHVRCALLPTSLSIPVAEGRCDLGTWQAVYLWEHRAAPHRRRLSVVVM